MHMEGVWGGGGGGGKWWNKKKSNTQYLLLHNTRTEITQGIFNRCNGPLYGNIQYLSNK